MKPTKVDINDYQKIVELYHNESDRAAAILAGSFVENYLVEYLKTCFLIADPEIDELFQGFGPMATFSQRIAIAYAVGAFHKSMRDNLRAIKEIRNHFAHHPGDAKFDDAVIDKHFKKLSFGNDRQICQTGDIPLTDRRRIYLLSIAWFTLMASKRLKQFASEHK